MKKIIVNFLILFGMVLLFISREAGATFIVLGIIGILIIVSGRKAEILDNWSALIRGAQGQRDQVITTTKELINISKAPQSR